MTKYQYWTKEDDKELSTLWQGGASMIAIMRGMGRSCGSISNRLSKLGLKRELTRLRAENKQLRAVGIENLFLIEELTSRLEVITHPVSFWQRMFKRVE